MSIFDAPNKITEDEAKNLVISLIQDCKYLSEYTTLAKDFWSTSTTYISNPQTINSSLETIAGKVELIDESKEKCKQIIEWLSKYCNKISTDNRLINENKYIKTTVDEEKIGRISSTNVDKISTDDRLINGDKDTI